MFALFAEKRAVRAARGDRATRRRIAAGLTAVTCVSACVPVAPPLTRDDPADPTARVAAVRYRSTIAPYASLRPAKPEPPKPEPWRERNDGDMPPPKADR